MHPISRVLVFCLSLAAAACGGALARGDGAGPATGGSVITRDEALASGAANAYDLVRGARPAWLRTRGLHSAENPAGDVIWVYLNNTRLGGPEALRQIAVADVGTIRYYDLAAANYRFGQGHLNGAIQVIPADGSEGGPP